MSLRFACKLLSPALWLIVALHAPARAQTVVNLCQTDRQAGQGMNLAMAMTRGGLITFACPANTTIQVTDLGFMQALRPTIIDGGGNVTLDGGSRPMTMFFVSAGHGPLTLRNIKIFGGQVIPPSPPGVSGPVRFDSSIVHSEESLVLEEVTIERSQTPIIALKDATIRNSWFIRNTSGAVKVRGNALIERTNFVGNGPGIALDIDGKADIRGGQFIDNSQALDLQRAGEVKNALFQRNVSAIAALLGSGQLQVTGSTFDRNVVAIAIRTGRLRAEAILSRNMFTGNGAADGRGVVRIVRPPIVGSAPIGPVTLELNYNRFVGNLGEHGGAVYAHPEDTRAPLSVVIRGGVFVNNRALEGGAVHSSAQNLVVTNSLFKANSAGEGSAILGRRAPDGTSWSIANSLIVENVSRTGGAALELKSVSLANVTVANNTGRGLSLVPSTQPPSVVGNTILSGNSAGNCFNVAAGSLKAGNLQFGASDCPGVAAQNPHLDTFYVPGVGSPARGAGDNAFCWSAHVAGVDMLFQARPQVGACSSGAYERPPVRTVEEMKKRTRRTCPDGTHLPIYLPCPEAHKDCPGGFSVPVSVSCPRLCPAGCAGNFPDCKCPCAAPCTGTQPNCTCPCPNFCTGTAPNCACPCPCECIAPATRIAGTSNCRVSCGPPCIRLPPFCTSCPK
jgi:hypothetical protein